MSIFCIQSVLRRSLTTKNWESNINQVSVEPCDTQEDPMGYKAVFFVKEDGKARAFERFKTESFAIGASYLAQRQHNLKKAGYSAPMTHKAIHLIENKLGSPLPMAMA